MNLGPVGGHQLLLLRETDSQSVNGENEAQFSERCRDTLLCGEIEREREEGRDWHRCAVNWPYWYLGLDNSLLLGAVVY